MDGDPADADRILSIEVGGKTVGANLEAAIAAGEVIRHADGRLELPERKGRGETYIIKPGDFGQPCEFLDNFMFRQIYGQKAVPIGCRDCYKVKVSSATLRQLMAVKEISEEFPGKAKSGAEIHSMLNQTIYGTYFYFLGLDKARKIYKQLRKKIDEHPKLGPAVAMIIKRGCTNYERSCGPSDRYTFDPRLADVEKYFWSRFVRSAPRQSSEVSGAIAKMAMVRVAYRIGDDTYKDLTDGKDLFRPVVTYDPDGPPADKDER